MGSLSLLQDIFQPRDRTQVSHIAGKFFNSWATREALSLEDWKQEHELVSCLTGDELDHNVNKGRVAIYKIEALQRNI